MAEPELALIVARNSSVPVFTLYADGTVVYLADGQRVESGLFVTRQGPPVARRFQGHIWDLSFAQLDSNEGSCIKKGSIQSMSVHRGRAGVGLRQRRSPRL